MKIETKLNIEDTIWCMYNNKVITCKVRYITAVARIDKQNNNELVVVDILYTPDCNIPDVAESNVFKTKQELINSL